MNIFSAAPPRRRGFVGGAAASASGLRRRRGLAFDRGWGPASDGTGGPSPDQMIEKFGWTDGKISDGKFSDSTI